jgi:hypothetical protein
MAKTIWKFEGHLVMAKLNFLGNTLSVYVDGKLADVVQRHGTWSFGRSVRHYIGHFPQSKIMVEGKELKIKVVDGFRTKLFMFYKNQEIPPINSKEQK